MRTTPRRPRARPAIILAEGREQRRLGEELRADVPPGRAERSAQPDLQGQPMVVPVCALVAAPAAGLVIGAVAGLYPATNAARLSPTEALRAT